MVSIQEMQIVSIIRYSTWWKHGSSRLFPPNPLQSSNWVVTWLQEQTVGREAVEPLLLPHDLWVQDRVPTDHVPAQERKIPVTIADCQNLGGSRNFVMSFVKNSWTIYSEETVLYARRSNLDWSQLMIEHLKDISSKINKLLQTVNPSNDYFTCPKQA